MRAERICHEAMRFEGSARGPGSARGGVSPLRWNVALGHRMTTLWFLKMTGTTLGIASFFPAYFWVMGEAGSRALVMPMVFVDHWFGPLEAALPLYASLWLYVSLPAAFAKDRSEFLRYAAATGAMAVVGFVIFWIAPTTVPQFQVDWALYPSLQFLKSADAAGNAFPSLHVAFAVLACAVLAGQLKAVHAPAWVRILNWIWAVGIVYSTLATRQHVALDVLGGMTLGWLCWIAFRPKKERTRTG